MYARVLWGKIKMGMWDEYERYYDQKIISSTDGVKGFSGRRLLRSLENPDEGISISLWETKEDMENYVKSTKRQELARDAEKLYSRQITVVSNGIPNPCPRFEREVLPRRKARFTARKKLLSGQPLNEPDLRETGEATSARVALRLRKQGISRIRPLAGGFQAWRERRFPVEPLTSGEHRQVS